MEFWAPTCNWFYGPSWRDDFKTPEALLGSILITLQIGETPRAGNFQIVILNFCGTFPLPTQLQDWTPPSGFQISPPKPTPKRRQNRMKNQVHKLTWFSWFFEGLAIMISMWAAGRPKNYELFRFHVDFFWGVKMDTQWMTILGTP